jgi:hypothetical protein
MEYNLSWESNRLWTIQEIYECYGTRKFITTFIISRHLPLFWGRLVQSIVPARYQKMHVNIILPSVALIRSWSVFFRFHHQNLYTPLFCPILAAFPGHLIFLDFTTREILLSSTDNEAPRYVVLSTPLLPRPCKVHIPPSTPCSQDTHSLCSSISLIDQHSRP